MKSNRNRLTRLLPATRLTLLTLFILASLLVGLGVWAAVGTKIIFLPMAGRLQPLRNAFVASSNRNLSKNLNSVSPAKSYATLMQACPADLTVTNGNTGTWVNTTASAVTIRITAVGAGGGKNTGTNNGAVNTLLGGSGASIRGEFTVAPGASIFLIAGAPGQNSLNGGSGGGGSGAVNCGNPANCGSGTILLLAGGGGGSSGFAPGGGGRAISGGGGGGTNNGFNAAGGGGLNSPGQDGIMVDAMNPNPAFFSTAKGGGQVSKIGISNGGAAGQNNGVQGTAGGNGMGGGGGTDGGGFASGGGGQTGGNGEDIAGGNNGGYSLPGGTNQTNTAGTNGGGANQGSVTLTCLGTVSAPEIAVSETGVGNIADGTSFGFGATKVGTSVTKTFTVTNSGTANLTLSNLSVPSGFTFTNFVSPTVAPNSSTTFTVTMTAAAAGAPSGSLSFDNNDAGKNPFNLTISGSVFAPPTVSKFFVNPNQLNLNNTSLNGTARLAIAITNPPGNPGSLTGLAITDTFPAGLEVDSPVVASNTCGGTFAPSAGATSISFSSGGSLTPGNQCTIFVIVKATTVGALVNTTSNVSSTEGGAGLTASGTLNVFVPPTIAKAFGASVIAPNTPTTMTFTITNPGGNPGNLTGVSFNDTLMSGLQIAPTPNLTTNGNCGSPTLTGFTNGSTALMVSGATVSTVNPCTLTVNVIGTTPGTVNNTTTAINSTNGGMGQTSNTATLIVASPPTVAKTFSPSLITPGGTSTATITLTNPNASLDLTGAMLTDVLPAGLTTVNATAATTCAGGTAGQTGNSFSLSGGTIPQGGSCTLTVGVTSATNGVYTNTLAAGDLTTANSGPNTNTASTNLTVAAPPTLGKAFAPNPITVGGMSTLTITLTNPNNNVPLTLSAPLTDTLPANVTTVNATAANTCGGTASQTSGSVTLTGGTIPAGGSCTLSVNVTSATVGGHANTIPANALLTNGGSNVDPASNTLVVGVAPQVDKTFTPTEIKTGATTTLSIAITNNNTMLPFNGVSFTDTLPAGLTTPDLPATPTCGGSLSVTSNVITLTGATIAAGTNCTTTFTVTGATVGVKNNTVTVDTSNFGTGYTDTAMVTVYDVATIAKSFTPTSILFGGTSMMSFVLSNPNSFAGGNLSGLSFTDMLPSGITVGTSGPTSVCGGTLSTTAPNLISFSGGTLGTSGPGNTCTISVNVTGAQLGMWPNTTGALSSTQTGVGATSNTATLTVTPSPTTTTITNAATLASTPTLVGESYAVNVTVAAAMGGSGTPSGTVSVSDGMGGTCMITLSGGTGSCNLTTTTAGAKTLTASYVGDTNFGNSSGTAAHTINKANTTTVINSDSPDPSVVGESVMVAYTVTTNTPGGGVPTGNVLVSDGVNSCTGTLNGSGQGSCNVALFTPGARTLTATYQGDANYNASPASAGAVHQVNKADTITTITSDNPDPSVFGQTVTVNFTVAAVAPGSGTPTGNVVITVSGGAETCTGTVAAGSCTLALTALGNRTLTATYVGGTSYNGSSDTEAHQVNKADTTTTIVSDNPDSSAVGQNVTVVYTVVPVAPGAGTPTGNVTVSDGVNSCTGTVAAGSCVVALTTPGSRTFTATYAGDANFNTSSDTEAHTVVLPPTIAKAFAPTTTPIGGTSTLTFTITNPAANTVALTGVDFTDAFPNTPNLVVAAPLTVTNTCGGTLQDSGGGALAAGDVGIKLVGGMVNSGSPCTVSVNVTPNAAGPFNNVTGTVSSTNGGIGNTASAILQTNIPPTINAVPVTSVAGSPFSNEQIATVNDAEDAKNLLIVTVNGAATAVSGGITINNVQVSNTGVVRANIVAACGAVTTDFTLRVTDTQNAYTEAILKVTVAPNTPPTLGYTAAVAASLGQTLNINPTAGPADNGTITTLVVDSISAGFTGTATVANNGVVTVSNAGPLGTHTITLKATDNCGEMTTTSFTLTVFPFIVQLSDPVLCTGDSTLSVHAEVTNPNAVPANLNFNATIPAPMSGIANTCTSSAGTCTITANNVTVTGLIDANQTVMIDYKVVVANGTPQGTNLCIDSTASFNGGPPAMVQACTQFICPVGGVVQASGQKPGSVLVFPYYNAKAADKSDTRMTISNAGDVTATVHVFFIAGASCEAANLFMCLTPHASFSFKASEYDPETTGWVFAVAVDAQGRPVRNNVLIGNAFVREGAYLGNYAAESFAARSGAVAALNADTATLFFDGTSYDAVPNQLAIEVQSLQDAPGQRLVTVGLRGDLTGSQMSGAGQFGTGVLINGNERPMGSFVGFLNGNCQAQATFSANAPRVPGGMNTMIPPGQVGTMQWQIGGGVGLLMTPSGGSGWNGIRALHKTRSTTSVITIPVFAPVC